MMCVGPSQPPIPRHPPGSAQGTHLQQRAQRLRLDAFRDVGHDLLEGDATRQQRLVTNIIENHVCG